MLLLALLVGSAAAADPPRLRYARALPGDSTRTDVAAGVLPLADGALITGWTSVAGGSVQGLVMRVDPEARVRWRREVGGDGADMLFGAQPDGAGGFVCAGFHPGDRGDLDGWIVRLDGDGATRWERSVGGAGDDRLTSIQSTRDGWIAAGQTARGGNTDAWVVRLDREGRSAGEWTWGGPGVERGLGVEPLAGGGCVIVGRIGDGREQVDGFVTRLDRAGRQVWTHTIGGEGFQVAYHVRAPRGGGLLVTGYAFTEPVRDHDGFVLRMSAGGRVIARADLGGPRYDRATQSVAVEGGGTVTVGYSKRPGAADADPAWQTMVYGLDARGRRTWSIPIDGDGVESGHAVATAESGLWVVTQVSPPGGGSRVLVVRLDVPAP